MKMLKTKWNSIPLAVKVSISYAICSILQKCLSFITLPLFTRLLTTEQYGQYTIYASWSGILTIFITLNLYAGSFSTAMVKYENNRDEYISSIQGICLFLLGLFFIVYFPLKDLWNKLFELPTLFVIIMALEIFFVTATQFWTNKKRFEYKYKQVVVITLLISILSPILAYILVLSTPQKGYARILGYAAINIFIGIIFFIINVKNGEKFFNKKYWKYALEFNIPLLVYYLSQVFFNQSDRIMISHMTGKSDAAMYGVAYNLAMILTFVLNAINDSYIPWLYKKIKNDEQKDNKSVSSIISIIMSLMILCVIWYAPEIINIMAGKQYESAIYVVAPVSMSLFLLFYSQLFINIQFYYEEKKLLVWASVLAAILNIVLNYALIPIFGYVVAGYTTLISYVIFMMSNYYAMKKTLKKNELKDNLYDYKSLFFVMITFFISGFLGVILYDLLAIRIIITILVLIVVIINRYYFIDILKKIKEK